ncbi:hypothetical protein YUYDRAFT_01176 [Streptomyces sp. ScaeMP-e48]|uniref:hypothetical protein n=1 Tax=Streptomyces TaxID=1883 RepID=UPI000823DBB3|nr:MULTISPECIES: hypothetical protein [Streptomyces]MCX4656539.1 hypothetical protein [Streptomyces microflavus]SCK13666.1 hypothetical protein YUYDRAFT_01176 [Streptomyces sp. ScaeMP-e48]
MSTSDQDQDRDQREGRDRGTDTPIAEAAAARATVAEPAEDAYDVEETGTDTEAAPEAGADLEAGAGASADPETGKRLTPRQARRLRIVLSSVGMVAMGVVLALRIASRSSVLVVGVYGLALILCGLVIELSRNGRTRLGSWLLGAGLVAAVGADWLLLP